MQTHVKAMAIIMLFIIAFPVCFSVFADNTVSITASQKTINSGENVTLYISINNSEPITGINASLSYNAESLNCSDSAFQTADSKVYIIKDINSENSINIPVAFTSIAPGKADFYLIGEVFTESKSYHIENSYYIDINEVEEADNTYKPEKSSGKKTSSKKTSSATSSGDSSKSSFSFSVSGDPYLTDLKISGAELIPAFNENITSYTANIGYSIDKVSITAKATSGGSIIGDGNKKLNVGDNKHTITVKSGSKSKSYNINIRRMTREETEIYEKTKALQNPLSVIIDDKVYTILTDVNSVGSFTGLFAEKTLRGETEVSYLRDAAGKYRLYYLTESEQKGRFFNQNKNGDFEKISYIIDGNSLYIANDIPDNIDIEDSYMKKNIQINGIDVPCLVSKQKSAKGIYIVYCYYDSEMGYYRYDSVQKTVSRFPEFAEQVYSGSDNNKLSGKLIDSFKGLNKSGKAVIIFIIIASIGIIITAIFIIIKVVKPHKTVNDAAINPENKLKESEIIEEDTGTFYDEDKKDDDF